MIVVGCACQGTHGESENRAPAAQARRLVIDWTAQLSAERPEQD